MKLKIPILVVLFVTTLMVLSTAASAATSSRLHASSVSAGEQFTVTVNVDGYGLAGKLVETIPAGFTFDGSTHYSFDQSGQTITFLLFGDTSIQYTVTAAGSEGTYDFDGELSDFDKNPTGEPGVTSIEVVGDTSIDPPVSNGVSATRDLPASVEPGEVFIVGMTASDYGTFGNIVETLPDGFSFVGSTLSTPQVIPDPANNTVMFLLLGDSSFEYTVMAPPTEEIYQFSGVIEDEDKKSTDVLGDALIAVSEEAIPPMPDENVSLDMGWNFISVPFALDNSSVDNVLAGVSYDALTYYNAETGIWVFVAEFEPLKGYWIHVTADGQSILASALESAVPASDTPSFPQSIPVYEGWNAVGYTDATTSLSAELSLVSIDESYSNIWGVWDPATNSYEYFGHNGQSGVIGGNHVGTDVFEMSPYKGYWVYLTQDDVLSAVS